jgi:hypothetical protein
MSPGPTYGLITFLIGILLLLAWLYATAGNPRSGTMLKKSLLLFALPIIFSPAGYLTFPLGAWVWIACEEGLKAFASTRERDRLDRFWLVTLFGIWELTVDKPFWGYFLAPQIANWGRVDVGELIYATVLPVLMHTVTAAIYAFTAERRIWVALIASWTLHVAFNEAVNRLGFSPEIMALETLILASMLGWILRRNPWGETPT